MSVSLAKLSRAKHTELCATKEWYVTRKILYYNTHLLPQHDLHIGHACVGCRDMMAKYKRLRGYDVFFLTGTDEHGQKTKVARERGLEPQEFVDRMVVKIKDLWKLMHVDYDGFIHYGSKHVKQYRHLCKAS